ncbi:ABC-type branched-subunit amino acid transport system substrate-binding protein [Krasilnikovia cinnamomea]|uniref:ABC-type branched-subunit amino acid transport system substrate-binding protein n=1 Tax=Krasilnikovia cinnamomea TaxID=349313 RepID=A0A4Q7ZMZ3_9ACTN|nr:ABC transporter substrate-binding protein [Krasilnikovia cinnamomea]RZU52392.1 ABC-type branched-subunit amino acid transport system substrate-binding protein [Krasilnikovia cinnamomea]
MPASTTGRPGLSPSRPLWRRPVTWLVIAGVLVAALAITAVRLQPRHWNACHGFSREYLHVWSRDGDCVGVTDGATPIDAAFGAQLGGRFGALLDAIRAENERVESGRVDTPGSDTDCTSTAGEAVDVAALAPWRSDLAGGRAIHQLAGMYVAQWRANHLRQPGGCVPFIRLLVADPGRDMNGWSEVVDELSTYDRLVAVVGLALSRTQMIEAARTLNGRGIPVVADVVTADGFDRSNFAGVPEVCHPQSGTGKLTQFYRIAYPNQRYFAQLGAYLTGVDLLGRGRAVQVTQAGYDSDQFTCTNVEHVNRLLEPAPDPITFELSGNGKDATGQIFTKVSPICTDPAVRTVFYTARAVDLATFVVAMNRACPRGITIAAGTDTTRLLTPETSHALEMQRQDALEVLHSGNVKLYFPATNSAARLAGSTGFANFKAAYTGAFAGTGHAELFPFTDAELADTWMVNAHDAMFVTAAAVHALHTNGQAYEPAHVASNLSSFEIPDAAQGTLRFDRNGTRVGTPVVLRLCSDGVAPSTQVVVPRRLTACPGDQR